MSQSLSNVLVHIIFSTKYRAPLIDESIQPELYAYITSIVSSHGSYLHKIGGIADHVHLLSSLPRTLSISSFLEEIKKSSSKWIKTKDSRYHHFSWQKGFGVFSVSCSQKNDVVAYISNQKERHKKMSYQDEFRKLLQLNEVPYDERYVWD